MHTPCACSAGPGGAEGDFLDGFVCVASCISSQVLPDADGCNMRGIWVECVLAQARQSNPRWNPAQACQRLPKPWSECIAAHTRCMAEMQAGDSLEAYAAITGAVQPFLKARDQRAALSACRRADAVPELGTCEPSRCSGACRAGRQANLRKESSGMVTTEASTNDEWAVAGP